MSPHGEEVQADDAVPLLTDGLSTTFSRIPTKKISNESSVGASFGENIKTQTFILVANSLFRKPHLTEIGPTVTIILCCSKWPPQELCCRYILLDSCITLRRSKFDGS